MFISCLLSGIPNRSLIGLRGPYPYPMALVTRGSNQNSLWKVGQILGLVLTGFLLIGLIAAGKFTLTLLWKVVIPVLPATFLVSPQIWRNLCPLASINMAGNGLVSRRKIPTHMLPKVGMIGIGLLALLVPARHLVFNENGLFLAIVIALVAIIAFITGFFFDSKAGFCNSVCPVLPVERLYGQSPLLEMENPRCTECRRCTAKTCIDLVAKKSIAQSLGGARKSHAWLKKGFGIFAASFPGFVLGYFESGGILNPSIIDIYLVVGAWSLASYVAVVIISILVKPRSETVLPILGATAAGIYYWHVGPVISELFGGDLILSVGIRLLIFSFLCYWLWNALRNRVPARHSLVAS